MSEENVNIQGDPKEYIRSLAGIGSDMEEKSKQEINKVRDEEQVLKDEKQDANLELQDSGSWSQFADNAEHSLSNIKSSAEETLKDIKEEELEDKYTQSEELDEKDRENNEEEEPLTSFSKDLSELYKKFKESIPKSLGELGRKAPDSTAFGEEVLKIVEFMDSLRFANNAMQACIRASLELPDEVRDSLVKISEESGKMRMIAEKRLKDVGFREKKVAEIKSNAENNLTPLERTIGRNSSKRIENIQKLRGVVSNSDIQKGIEKVKEETEKAPYDQVTNRITSNMEANGATQEEINQAIENAKARINQAIAEERVKNNQTGVSTAPSSYTTPLS